MNFRIFLILSTNSSSLIGVFNALMCFWIASLTFGSFKFTNWYINIHSNEFDNSNIDDEILNIVSVKNLFCLGWFFKDVFSIHFQSVIIKCSISRRYLKPIEKNLLLNNASTIDDSNSSFWYLILLSFSWWLDSFVFTLWTNLSLYLFHQSVDFLKLWFPWFSLY